MRISVTTIVCVGTLYFVDAYFFNGIYFNAFRGVIYHLWYGY
jgi:hypothetical protein